MVPIVDDTDYATLTDGLSRPCKALLYALLLMAWLYSRLRVAVNGGVKRVGWLVKQSGEPWSAMP